VKKTVIRGLDRARPYLSFYISVFVFLDLYFGSTGIRMLQKQVEIFPKVVYNEAS